MEIHNQNKISLTGSPASRKVVNGQASKTESPEMTAQGSTEKQSLSGVGSMISQITQRLMNESPVDEPRVARLAAQIQSGQYQINDQRVAGKMITLDQSVQQNPNDS